MTRDAREQPERQPEYWTSRPVEARLKKKALLVGIQYEGDEESEDEGDTTALRGPHADVASMRDLLIECYGYASEDVVVLVDTGEPEQMQPTRENMLREIQNLVQDAQSGDRFFFHYAGHTVQVPNRSGSEEDGMDECIIPSDGEAKMIKDNELRKYLVDSLPIGSNLVAIFDSCHSATLLDLDHFRCNRAYVPWISKGNRRTDSRWNDNVRRPAILVTSRHVYQTKRISASNVRSTRTSIDKILYDSKDYKKLSIRTRSLSIRSDLEPRWYDSPSSPIRRCVSPDSMWPCTGSCVPSSPKEATVISLAACKDNQLSWEDTDGASMTTALINVLKTDPHPTLISLLARVSHELHNFYLRLHGHAREHRKIISAKNRRRAERRLPPLRVERPPEMNNFQDPQLSSHRPLDRNARWDP